MVAYEVYRQQCCDFIRLQAWYVWHLHVQRQVPREGIFDNQLVRLLYERPGAAEEPSWRALQATVLEECRQHGTDTNTTDLEERVLGLVRAFVDDRYIREVLYAAYQENVVQASPYYGFTHDIGGERLTLHFTNTVDPDSPLRHLPQLRAGLQRLLSEVREQHPDLTVAYCGSWLNSVPRFTDLFPPTWLAGAEASPPAGHGGWWGQFTDRTGALHEDNARYLRETGDFRFQFLRCTCPLDELQSHLMRA